MAGRAHFTRRLGHRHLAEHTRHPDNASAPESWSLPPRSRSSPPRLESHDEPRRRGAWRLTPRPLGSKPSAAQSSAAQAEDLPCVESRFRSRCCLGVIVRMGSGAGVCRSVGGQGSWWVVAFPRNELGKRSCRWKELGAKNCYLADVEVYEIDGSCAMPPCANRARQRRALHGAVEGLPESLNDAMATQELVDPEVVGTGRLRSSSACGGRNSHPAGQWRPSWGSRGTSSPRSGRSLSRAAIAWSRTDGKKWFRRCGASARATGALPDEGLARVRRAEARPEQEPGCLTSRCSSPRTVPALGVWRVSEHAGPLREREQRDIRTADGGAARRALESCRRPPLRRAAAAGSRCAAATSLRGDTTCSDGNMRPASRTSSLAFETGRPRIGWDKRS